MDAEVAAYFASVIELAKATFQTFQYTTDSTPQRSILRLEAAYGPYRVLVTELFSNNIRKYRYYLLRGNYVEAGFDNSPDPRAIRLKYGTIGQSHAGEHIPHVHRADKAKLALTDAMDFERFVEWLKGQYG